MSTLEWIAFGAIVAVVLLVLYGAMLTYLFLTMDSGPFWVRWAEKRRARKATPTTEVEEPQEQRTAALPIDPENPPTWKVYQPREGAPKRACACHPDRELRYGQKVMWWPVPNSGGAVNVYCEDGVQA